MCACVLRALQEERMLRQKTNERFLDFVKRCEEACPAVKTTFKAFDAPYRALKFTGMCCLGKS